ncbi:hypothetical protein HK096_005977 [Nowakowskiella sp. JEL0078]|nr:hypothetical protein HK096_005977 [Nowakowskiella sp. JEL0078]
MTTETKKINPWLTKILTPISNYSIKTAKRFKTNLKNLIFGYSGFRKIVGPGDFYISSHPTRNVFQTTLQAELKKRMDR